MAMLARSAWSSPLHRVTRQSNTADASSQHLPEALGVGWADAETSQLQCMTRKLGLRAACAGGRPARGVTVEYVALKKVFAVRTSAERNSDILASSTRA